MENCNKKYHLITYGCQMNLHESEKIAGILTKLGYTSTDDQNLADYSYEESRGKRRADA